jgi:hypothetical protein
LIFESLFFREKLEIASQEKENLESNCRQLNISHNLLKNELNELNSLKERFVSRHRVCGYSLEI